MDGGMGAVRKVLLLMAGFGAAGCMIALLLVSAGICGKEDKIPAPVFTVPQATPAPLAQTEKEKEAFTLPQIIPGTSLLALRLCTYEGPFLEDGSNRNVFDCVALEIQNMGSQMVEQANVLFGEDLIFELTYFPPGARILVLEKNGKTTAPKLLADIRGSQVYLEDSCNIQKSLRIRDASMGETEVTNLSGETIGPVILQYKNSLGTEPLYLGGITYSYLLPNLKPGETVVLNLPDYAMGFSSVVAVIE